jgi:hypothetical protein
MGDSQMNSQELEVLKWGGLSGMIGGVLLLLVMVFVAVFIGTEEPKSLSEWVERFPEIHMARVIENILYLSGLLLQIPLFLALFRALRKESLAAALFGSAIGIAGLVPMIASATPHVAHAPLAEIYNAGAASAEVQEAIGVMWQATWGVFNAPLYVGFFVVPVGIFICGLAMFGSSAFGRGLRWLSVILGCSGMIAAVLQMIDPASPAGIISYLTLIIFGFAAGMRMRRQSK